MTRIQVVCPKYNFMKRRSMTKSSDLRSCNFLWVLGCIAAMQPIATDGVAWSVSQSVCLPVGLVRDPCKTAKPIEIPIGEYTRVSL